MWIFGYGSLIWSGWEEGKGCLGRETAMLPKYRRSFSKASVRNWGTREYPCPTLNLVRDETGSCQGIAFQFEDDRSEEVIDHLQEREGGGFEFKELDITLEGNHVVQAHVPIYYGDNVVDVDSTADLASQIRLASGMHGDCSSYLQGIVEELAKLRIVDEDVQQLWDEFNRSQPRDAG